jgi:hypothetical protein
MKKLEEGGVAEGWTDAELMAKGGGAGKKYTVTDIKYDTDGEDTDLPTEMEITVPKGMTDSEEILEFISNEISDRTGFSHEGFSTTPQIYAKGGGIKQKGSSDTSLDKLEKAKRVGYRFTDKKAKQLHLGANAKPTEEEIKKMKNGKGVYYENRKNRSDKSRMKKLEDGGGVAEGWTDAELMAKGGGVESINKGDKFVSASTHGDNRHEILSINKGIAMVKTEYQVQKSGDNLGYFDRIKKSGMKVSEIEKKIQDKDWRKSKR